MEQPDKEPQNEYNTQVIKALKVQSEEVDSWLDKLKNLLFQAEEEIPETKESIKKKKN
jgi:hypothetical protein